MKLSHQIIAFLVAFIWGTNFVLIRYALDEIQPFALATLRFLFVALPLVFFFPKPDVPWRYLIGYGLLIGAGQFGLLFWAMEENMTPGLASLIIQVQVFFTVGLTLVALNERITIRQSAAMLIGAVGLFLIVVFTDGETTIFGVLIVLVAAFSWASGNLVVKYAGKVDAFAFLVWSSLFAVPPLAVVSLLYQEPALLVKDVLNLSVVGWGSVMWQSVGNMLIGYGLWNMLLHRYPAALVTPWALLVPVFGMSTSWLVLDEVMPWWKLAAMALIVAGLALNATEKPKAN